MARTTIAPPQSSKRNATQKWTRTQLLVLGLLVVQNASVVLLMRFTRLPKVNGGKVFISSTIVMLTEVCKFYVSLVLMLIFDHAWSVSELLLTIYEAVFHDFHSFLKMSVPSLIYVINNNLIYVAISHLEPAVFQVVYQIKVVFAAVCAVAVFQKSLGKRKWFAVCLLFVGVSLVQWPSDSSKSKEKSGQNSLLGVLCAATGGLLSSVAGVYIELVMKRGTSSKKLSSPPSLWLKNLQLAFFAAFMSCAACYTTSMDDITQKGFFHGYDRNVFGVLVLQTGGGLLIGAVLKYADNILKAFATSVSTVIATVASIYLFDFNITFLFAVGASTVMYSLYLYSLQ